MGSGLKAESVVLANQDELRDSLLSCCWEVPYCRTMLMICGAYARHISALD
jgi:hypothetical protein